MKTLLCLLACLAALTLATAQSPQPPAAPSAATPPPGENFNSRLQTLITKAAGAPEPVLTKFSLDFPGGTPKQLVAAIEKTTAKPLNAIIPPEHADVKLPPLKMSNVDVRQLFQALELTSQKTEAYVTGTYYGGGMGGAPSSSYQQVRTSYGFRTQGQISDESIWYFYVEKPTLPPTPPVQVHTPPRVCRYFSLSPYLESGQTVEDITTAIQTGWKMLGDKETPTISFHKETRLLIAVGEPEKLETIDAVLKALRPGPTPPPFIDPATGLPVPATRPGMPQRALKAAPPGATVPPGEPPAPAKL
jgi:hypothetical protein